MLAIKKGFFFLLQKKNGNFYSFTTGMKYQLWVMILVVTTVISCSLSNDLTPQFTSITATNELGYLNGTPDYSDWKLNDEFTNQEKSLFDTINFQRTFNPDIFPNLVSTELTQPGIVLYPNPSTSIVKINYYIDIQIVNVAIVNWKFERVYAARFLKSKHFEVPVTQLNQGFYRMYYVVQDSLYNVIHCGHGDISKY